MWSSKRYGKAFDISSNPLDIDTAEAGKAQSVLQGKARTLKAFETVADVFIFY
jgi:hypothetical protein